jgi:hypothetical protein
MEPLVPRTAADGGRSPRGERFSTFELLLLASFAALVAVGNLALRLPIKIPGHSGAVWMAVLVTARSAVPRAGAATLTGLLAGGMASLLGIGDRGALVTLLSYTAAGAGVDAVLLGSGARAGAVRFALAGAAGNVAKLGLKTLLELWIGIPAGFVLFGRLPALLTHLFFGAAGGALGCLVVRALQRAGYFAYLAERR